MRVIRLANQNDITAVMLVIEAARDLMHSSGNTAQWINGYPAEQDIIKDIHCAGGYVVEDNSCIVAYFAFLPDPEPTYAQIYGGSWLNDRPYYVIHRLASLPQVHGIFADIVHWAFLRTDTLRIDTHRNNLIMQHNLLKHGFSYCGIIYLTSGAERLAYQKTV